MHDEDNDIYKNRTNEAVFQIKEGVNGTIYEMVKNYADYNFEENSTIPMDYMQSTVNHEF